MRPDIITILAEDLSAFILSRRSELTIRLNDRETRTDVLAWAPVEWANSQQPWRTTLYGAEYKVPGWVNDESKRSEDGEIIERRNSWLIVNIEIMHEGIVWIWLGSSIVVTSLANPDSIEKTKSAIETVLDRYADYAQASSLVLSQSVSVG